MGREIHARPTGTGSDASRRIEDVHLRNYDFDSAYDLEVRLADESGETVLSRQFYARPGWSRSLPDRLPPGEYEVSATLDGETTASGTCRIGDEPEHGVLIECGNGRVSVAQGIY